MRIGRDLAVLGHDRALKDTSRRDEQLVGRIAMEYAWQLGGLHDNLR